MLLDRAKEMLNYNAETGEFTWRKTFGSRAVAGGRAGCRRKDGYVLIRIDGVLHYAHQLAVLMCVGNIPVGDGVIDHIDGDPSNNRFSNLRVVAQAGNTQNRKAANKNSKTGMRGVSQTIRGKYQAQVMVNRRHVFRNYFDSFDEAVAAVSVARAKHMPFATV